MLRSTRPVRSSAIGAVLQSTRPVRTENLATRTRRKREIGGVNWELGERERSTAWIENSAARTWRRNLTAASGVGPRSLSLLSLLSLSLCCSAVYVSPSFSLSFSLCASVSSSLCASEFQKWFEGKIKTKCFYRIRGHILRSTEVIFRLTQFSEPTKQPILWKNISEISLKPKKTQS